jgi:hypothetical protein
LAPIAHLFRLHVGRLPTGTNIFDLVLSPFLFLLLFFFATFSYGVRAILNFSLLNKLVILASPLLVVLLLLHAFECGLLAACLGVHVFRDLAVYVLAVVVASRLLLLCWRDLI